MKSDCTNFAVMRMLVTAIAYVLCATACQTVVSKDRAIQTEIVTDPPGARIQINGEYIGNAPVKHAFQQDAGGKVIGSYTILATSVNPNELPESGWLGANLRVPPKLVFQLKPAAAFENFTVAPTFPESVQYYSIPTEAPVATDAELPDDAEASSDDFTVAPPVLQVVQPSGKSSPAYPIIPGATVPDYSQPGLTANGDAFPGSFRATDSYGNVWRTTPDNLGPNHEGGYRTTDSYGNVFRTTPNNLGPNHEGSYRATDSSGNIIRITPNNLGPNH